MSSTRYSEASEVWGRPENGRRWARRRGGPCARWPQASRCPRTEGTTFPEVPRAGRRSRGRIARTRRRCPPLRAHGDVLALHLHPLLGEPLAEHLPNVSVHLHGVDGEHRVVAPRGHLEGGEGLRLGQGDAGSAPHDLDVQVALEAAGCWATPGTPGVASVHWLATSSVVPSRKKTSRRPEMRWMVTTGYAPRSASRLL